MIKSIQENCEVIRILESEAAGNTDTLTSDAVNMSGFESALFIFTLGAVTAGGLANCYLQQSSDDASADAYADLEGSAVSSTGNTATKKIITIEIINPQERYLKALIDRTIADVVVESINVIKFGAKAMPITQDSTVDATNQVVAPDEGTK